MDDLSPVEEFKAAASAPPPSGPTLTFQTIAPWWHTVLLLMVFALWATLSHFHSVASAASMGTSHAMTYASQIWISWMLLGCTVAGLYHRRRFFRVTLTQNAGSWIRDAWRGALTYMGLYFIVIIAFGVLAATHAIQLPHSHSETGTAETTTATSSKAKNSASPLTPPPEPATTKNSPRDFTHLFDNKAVRTLAPRNPVDLLLWLCLSLTAAFVEEHVFRGYLLWQTRVGFMRIRLPTRAATLLAILVTSMLFGSLHLYEGVGAACFITCLGAFYCIVALRYSNLRAVIVAHFLQDFLAGLLIYVHAVRAGGGT